MRSSKCLTMNDAGRENHGLRCLITNIFWYDTLIVIYTIFESVEDTKVFPLIMQFFAKWKCGVSLETIATKSFSEN